MRFLLAACVLTSSIAHAESFRLPDPAPTPAPPPENEPDPVREPPKPEPLVQSDLGLTVVMLGYEQPVANQISLQLEAGIMGTYFLPWFDLGSPMRPWAWTQIPFFKSVHIELWWPLYLLFVMFIIVGCSNAVNLTDGLDGLAAGLSTIAAVTFGVFAYLLGRVDAANYLNLFYIPGAGELTIFCVALAGGCMGFLWFNAHPAEVFMGDTGSLAIGGVLGCVAVLLRAEFLLGIVGAIFVAEALSVMLQTVYFKYTKRRYGSGRRIFRMAPLHHHFEQIGWHESKVIIRFWIMGIMCALVAFATLKIR